MLTDDNTKFPFEFTINWKGCYPAAAELSQDFPNNPDQLLISQTHKVKIGNMSIQKSVATPVVMATKMSMHSWTCNDHK